MKKRMRKAGILLVVFVAAIFVSSLFMNNGVDDQIIDLGDPTLPRISFQKEGRTVNALAGYVNEMDVTAMRAPPITAITHIQKTAPGPPAAIAVAIPAIFPVPTRDAVEIISA